MASVLYSAICDPHLRLQAYTVILAGYETTANTLAFAIYNLALNPGKAAKLMAEIDAQQGEPSYQAQVALLALLCQPCHTTNFSSLHAAVSTRCPMVTRCVLTRCALRWRKTRCVQSLTQKGLTSGIPANCIAGKDGVCGCRHQGDPAPVPHGSSGYP